ncbi:MAG: hypothetical protein EZS28_045294 [Streblomastix strix]|uniref:Uncharacterized protein n=1 Tax=Streblomastix strix TaxID=222440 RepID=A0A5J4TMH5_9EUKA|nr:MAG: hypothetical protein EZS28_045294 [Streblomastix strix]
MTKKIKIKKAAALIGKLNFLRTKFWESSFYLMLIDSAKTRAKIAENKKQQIQDLIPQATVQTDASPQSWGAKLELDYGEILLAHEAWLSYQIHWTSNRKELQAIHLRIIAFARDCKEMQITYLLD